MDTWDTDQGHIFVAYRDGCDDRYTRDGQEYRVDLGIGSISGPQGTLENAQAFLRHIEEKYPEIAGRLEIVRAACAFARRDSWIVLEGASVTRRTA